MLQCTGTKCAGFINPDHGPQKKLGLRRTVRDRYGNEIIAEIQCQDCTDGVSGLPDQEAVGAGAS